MGRCAAFLLAGLAAGASEAAPSLDKPETDRRSAVRRLPGGPPRAAHARLPVGRYVVRGRADAADPESPELITRTFLMDVSVGRFDRAATLAESELKLDSTDAMAELVLLVERVKAGDKAGALKRADALPQEGVHRFVGPLARAWTRMAVGDVAGADEALQGSTNSTALRRSNSYQLGLLYDFAGNAELAAGQFQARRSKRAGSSTGG